MPRDPIRVLLVDDDEDDYQLTRDYLSEQEPEAYQLDWASSFEDGLAALQSREHDVYLLDYQLTAGGTGLDLLKRAGELDISPVVLLTGKADDDLDEAALELGAADFLDKHKLDADTLVRAIRYAHRQAETIQALRRSEERYALATMGAQDGLWDWDLERGRLFLSARWLEMLGDDCGDQEGEPEIWFDRVHADDRDSLRSALEMHLEGVSDQFVAEYRVTGSDGAHRWMFARGVAVRDAEGRATRIAGSQTDVTERKQADLQLRYDVSHDALTGVPNRKYLVDRLERMLRRAQAPDAAEFALLFLDLDRFKIINDSLGHSVGDQLLSAIARRLEVCVRPGDVVARAAGDEFAVLLPSIRGIRDVLQVATRIQHTLKVPFELMGHEIFTSASIGIALSSTGYEQPDEILRDADIAMYRAKTQGPGRHQIFDRRMHERALEILEIETEMRRAVERGEFFLLYQPIYSLDGGVLTGVEALLRWRRPGHGVVLPEEFVPLAEENRLILPIGLWVLQEACAQAAKWQRQLGADDKFHLSVNLSRLQLLQTDLVNRVEKIVAESGLRPGSLHLEVTEGMMMEPAVSLRALLDRLKALDIHLHIDDFGTGYSSMSMLQQMPVDTLKIDKSFIQRMGSDPANFEIVRAMVNLARNLRMKVIAEGVESKEQLGQLESLDCESAQGFYLAEPMEVGEVDALLATHSAKSEGDG